MTCVILVRYRPWLKTRRLVREFLLVAAVSNGTWTWPTEVPARFADRVLRTVLDADGIRVIQVASTHHAIPVVRLREEMGVNGVWVVDGDFDAVGGINDLGVLPCANVYGIAIAGTAIAAFRNVAASVPPGDLQPVPVYHGSDARVVSQIQTQGLTPSFGMVGEAVSVGTFWKATRYASRTLLYEWREQGVVVRAYLDPGRLCILDGTGPPCPCEHCAEMRLHAAAVAQKHGLPPTYNQERTRVADHEGAWKQNYDTVYIGVVKASGASKFMYVTKNAEYAVAQPAERLELQCMALLDMTSMVRPHWDPLQRDQRIQ